MKLFTTTFLLFLSLALADAQTLVRDIHPSTSGVQINDRILVVLQKKKLPPSPSKHTLYLEGIARGIYFLKLRGPEGSKVVRVVKE